MIHCPKEYCAAIKNNDYTDCMKKLFWNVKFWNVEKLHV